MKNSLLFFLSLLSLNLLFHQQNANAQAPDWNWSKGADGYLQNYDNLNGTKSIATDAAGYSYVTGTFASDSITFGNFTLHKTNGIYDKIFLVKYDPSGNVLWATSVRGKGYQFCYGITVDLTGNIYITGTFSDSTYFGNDTLTDPGYPDIFIAKYNDSGVSLWVRTSKGNYEDFGCGIKTDLMGNVYVTGIFYSSVIIFGDDTLKNPNGGLDVGGSGIFIAKYDSMGNLLWVKGAVGNDVNGANSIAIDKLGNAYITGFFDSDSIRFDNYSLFNAAAESGRNFDNIFVYKFDPSGKVLWAKSASGVYDAFGNDIITDAFGNVFVAGNLNGFNVIFGNDTIIFNGYSSNVFFTKFDSTGNLIWARTAQETDNSFATNITTDMSGDAYFIGDYDGQDISFGKFTLFNLRNSNFNYYFNIFVAKYDPIGNVLWAKNLGGTADDFVDGISADAAGNLYLTGEFNSSSIGFDNDTLMGNGYNNFFVAELGNNTTGIEPFKSSNVKISIYPNPSNSQIIIQYSPITSKSSVQIFNAMGEEIENYLLPAGSSNVRINVAHLSSGVYFCKIQTGDKVSVVKFIKQ